MTGRYTGRSGGRRGVGFVFQHEAPDEGQTFTIDDSHFVAAEIDLQLGDRATIALFYEDGPMFLVMNHRNQQHKVFAEAVFDLYYFWKDGESFLRRQFLGFRLDRHRAKFAGTSAFARILQRVDAA